MLNYLATLFETRRRRALYRQMENLDDYLLDDIGLSRIDLRRLQRGYVSR